MRGPVPGCRCRSINAAAPPDGGVRRHRGWLYAVAVSPGHRRHGIGAALVRHAVVALQSMGCIEVTLQVRATNAAVVELYESLGIEVEE